MTLLAFPAAQAIEYQPDLGQVIHAIYRSVLENEPWRDALVAISGYIACDSTAIVVRPSTSTDMGFLICHPATGPSMEIAYKTKWYRFDPFVDLPLERSMLVSDLMSNKTWQDSVYYKEFLSPGIATDADRVMGVDIATRAGTICRLRLYRVQELPPFSAESKARLDLLTPHIKQALTLAAHVTRNETERKIYEEGLNKLNIGVIVLDERAQLLRANPVACHILGAGDGLQLNNRELEACTAGETRELRRLISAAQLDVDGVAAMSLSRPSGLRKLAVVVRSIPMIEESEGRGRPAFAVFLRDPDALATPAQEVARQLFDFTPAEANFAIELVNGLSLDEAAAKLGIRRNTARAHLRSIFTKAGVTRQSELVRVLLNTMLGLAEDGTARLL